MKISGVLSEFKDGFYAFEVTDLDKKLSTEELKNAEIIANETLSKVSALLDNAPLDTEITLEQKVDYFTRVLEKIKAMYQRKENDYQQEVQESKKDGEESKQKVTELTKTLLDESNDKSGMEILQEAEAFKLLPGLEHQFTGIDVSLITKRGFATMVELFWETQHRTFYHDEESAEDSSYKRVALEAEDMIQTLSEKKESSEYIENFPLLFSEFCRKNGVVGESDLSKNIKRSVRIEHLKRLQSALKQYKEKVTECLSKTVFTVDPHNIRDLRAQGHITDSDWAILKDLILDRDWDEVEIVLKEIFEEENLPYEHIKFHDQSTYFLELYAKGRFQFRQKK